ncbi:MAG TPA: hypothetical protein VK307_10190 [Thermoleophilaceae bacterium]|nr:hypothetical protein [Thermoleophilaceae bacterium]
MADFESPYLKGKTLEELIEDLGRPIGSPGSVTHEMMKAAISAKMNERLATPRKWAMVALGAAVISAGAAVASAVAAFS